MALGPGALTQLDALVPAQPGPVTGGGDRQRPLGGGARIASARPTCGGRPGGLPRARRDRPVRAPGRGASERVGLTTFIGPNSVTAAGLAPRFVMLIGYLDGGPVVLLVGSPSSGRRRTGPSSGRSRRVAPGRPAGRATRSGPRRRSSLVPCSRSAGGLVPLGLAWSSAARGSARSATRSCPARRLVGAVRAPGAAGAPEVVALLVVGWLVSELIATIAIRLAMFDGRGVPDALGRALAWVVRRPVRSWSACSARRSGASS